MVVTASPQSQFTQPQRSIEVFPDVAQLVDRAAQHVIQQLQSAIAQKGQATIALAGGSTPRPLYEILAQANLPWTQIQVFWGDERYVPADHPDSNYRMARLAWLDQVNFPSDNIHPVTTTATDPVIAAQAYEQTLREVFGPQDIPEFDVMLLGIGDDGHTASLFPQTAALQVHDRLVTVGAKDGAPRITFTFPVINRSALVLFLVAGASKQTALKQIFADQTDGQQYPASLVKPQGNLIWLLDQAAAEGIPN
jgi:6-phosphogluconolactonase